MFYYRRAKRAIIWNILYYSLSLFCTFYLREKQNIVNWDVVLVFLPLIIVGCSSETISINREQESKVLRPYCFIDLITKFIAYINSQLIYRHIAEDLFFWMSISLFSMCVVVSLLCSWRMIKRSKK